MDKYIEGKLKRVNKIIDKNNINIILDTYPRVIENKEEQEIVIEMINNCDFTKDEDIKKYFMKIENRVKAEDIVFIRKILKNVKETIKYLSKEEMEKLKEKLEYNPLYDRKWGRRLNNGYEILYEELKRSGIKKEELNIETSKAYIYAKIGPDGFTCIQENSKLSADVKKKVLKNYKKGILELDFYLLENKKNKSVKEADKELTKEILARVSTLLENLDAEEKRILKRRLEFNSATCRKHGTRLINVYNRIYYALKRQGIKELELSIEASKAYIYSKICKVGFYSIQCNETKYKDKSIERVLKNYKKEFEHISYYLLDNKTNVPKLQADREITSFILENTKEITNNLNKKEKNMLEQQLLKNYEDSKTARLIVAYNKIYYELKTRGIKEPELSMESSKVYLYAKIAQVGFTNILGKEREVAKETIIKILEQYKENLNKLDFYILSNNAENRTEAVDKKLTEKILLNTKEIVEKLSSQQQEKLKEMLLKNSKAKGNKGIKLINAYNRIYCEMKSKGIVEPELTKEASKAYMYAKISEFGFYSLICNDKKYTNKNLKRLFYEYKKEIENIEYYLLDNKYDKSVIEADKELTNKVLSNIKEILDRLDKNEIKILKEKLLANSKSNTEKGTRLINVYNRIYCGMKKEGIKEPELSIEASKAYVYSKICQVGFNSLLKGEKKEQQIKKILKNYKDKLNNINYYLLKDGTQKSVEADDKRLTEYVLQHTKSVTKALSKEEMQKLEMKLLYNIKSNLEDGIRQRNAFNRIYCEMKEQGLKEPELTVETCKAYLYAKIGPISFNTIVRYNKDRTNINLKNIIKNYKKEIKKIDYYLTLERSDKSVEEADKELTEYVIEQAKEYIKDLSIEKQEILKEKLLYNMKSLIKHGMRLKNAYNKIFYALKKRGLIEPNLSVEASKAYIYTKVISKQFSSIILNNKRHIEKNLEKIINEYQEGIKNLDCYLHVSNKSNSMYEENKKLVEYILLNTNDILEKLTKEENKKIKEILLKRCSINSYITVFNRIYNELKREGINKDEITKKTCRVYLYGEIGPIGFNSIINNEKEYGNKNLKIIIEKTDKEINLLDYYLLYDRNKTTKEENIELSEKVYLEITNYFPNLNQNQKEMLRRKLLRNNDKELRFINAYNKIYYTLKKSNMKEISKNAKRIYAYIKLTQKGFDRLVNNKLYCKDDLSEEKIKQCLKNFKELDFYFLESYEGKSLKEADKIFTKKVLEDSEILEQMNSEEIKHVTKLLLKNRNKYVKLVMVYNKIYYELSKKGLKGQKLIKEASKAYIYSKVAKCGFSEIQDNTKNAKAKMKKVVNEYSENIKNIKLYLINDKKPKDKKDEILTNNILLNAGNILELLNKEEKIKLKEKLLHNSHKGARLINVYNKIYYELMKKRIEEPELTKEATKAYIYAKIGPDGYCDIRDNNKNCKKILQKVMNNYSERIYKIKYYLLDFLDDKNVYEADKLLIKNVLLESKSDLGKLYYDSKFIEKLNYNSQNKTKMITVYNKIYFELSKTGLKDCKLNKETSKAFIYAKIGPEGFKQIQNNNEGSDEYVLNVIKYYKQGIEIIKQDYENEKIDFTKRILYQKGGIRKRIDESLKKC